LTGVVVLAVLLIETRVIWLAIFGQDGLRDVKVKENEEFVPEFASCI